LRQFIFTLCAASLVLATVANASPKGIAWLLGARQETEETE
jgi:hypothetical protein